MLLMLLSSRQQRTVGKVEAVEEEHEGGKWCSTARFFDLLQNTFGMVFAWSFMWSTRWMAMDIPIIKELDMGPETMVGKLLIAMFLSCMSLLLIFFLDTVEDA